MKAQLKFWLMEIGMGFIGSTIVLAMLMLGALMLVLYGVMRTSEACWHKLWPVWRSLWLSTIGILIIVAFAGCVHHLLPPYFRPGVDNRFAQQTTKAATFPPTPALAPKLIATNYIAPAPSVAAITMFAQSSRDLTNWQTFGTMTTTQFDGNVFFRTYLAVTHYPIVQPVNVTTYRYDNTRCGANTNETILTPVNVNTNSFGRLWSYPVDSWMYAQPLLVSGIAGHNAVYAETLSNSLYCIDADNGALIWSNNLGTPVALSQWTNDLYPLGILSTPVIDPAAGRLYVVSWKQPAEYDLSELNITNGLKIASTAIAQMTNAAFNPYQFINRSALLLAFGNVYVAWASATDDGAPSCIMSFDAATLQQNAIWNTGGGGIWMSGCGPAADDQGIYFSVGNYVLGATNVLTPPASYQDSVVRLSRGLTLLDYFCPSNAVALSTADVDVGSGGVILLPGNQLLACGKEGMAYLLDRGNLGGYDTNRDHVIQQWPIGLNDDPGGIGHGCWSAPAWFNGMVYYHGWADFLKTFAWTGTNFSTKPQDYSISSLDFYVDDSPVVSANGTNDAICWRLETDAFYGSNFSVPTNPGPAVLHAYDAYSVSHELWNSGQNTNDAPGLPLKFTIPVVANGKVYLGTQKSLSAYGLK
jgi:hypothetical protein